MLHVHLPCPSQNEIIALGGSLTTSGILGWHMTASIGGADMPVGKCFSSHIGVTLFSTFLTYL